MIYALLLLSSLVQAQEVSTTTAIPLLDQIQISNLGKDTRSLLSGRYTQTGKPTFKNGICFGDATCQTTAPVARSVSMSSMSLTASIALTSVFTCPAGSTVAFTPSSAFVVVRAKASGRTAGNGAIVDMVVLKDGAPIPPATSAISDSRLRAVSADSTNEGDLTFNKFVSVTPNVSVNFCLAGRGTGTPSWYCDTAVCYLEVSNP